jgi:transposase
MVLVINMRISISKSKNAEVIFIIKSVTINGKRTSKTVESLGNINNLMNAKGLSRDEVILWAKDYAQQLTLKEKSDNQKIILKLSPSKQLAAHKQKLYNGGYLFLKQILKELRLTSLCREISENNKIEYDFLDIVSNLVCTRIIEPTSKRSSLTAAKRFIEQPKFDEHQVYRALDVLKQNKNKIEAHLYHASNNIFARDTSVLYFDCTNYFFEVENASGLRQYGKSKENRPNPIVQMGLFLDGNGIPLSFCINPGNQNEQKSLKPLENQMVKDFKLSKFVVCTDAGLNSKENRVFNNTSNRSYIVTQSLKSIKKYIKEWALDSEKKEWSKKGSNIKYCLNEIDLNTNYNSIFYKERWINENGIEQRLIVSFSPKYKLYQEKIRNEQVGRAEKKIEKPIKRKGKTQNDVTRFIDEKPITEHGEIVNVLQTLDVGKIEEEARYDGFYAVCTTLEDDISKIIEINKRRWEIEESFRIMKTDFKSRPVFVRKDDRIEAHFIICFISLLVYRLLERKLKEEYTVSEIVNTLKSFNFLKIDGEGYIPAYTRTELTDKLHDILKNRTDTEIVSEKNMKKILKTIKL